MSGRAKASPTTWVMSTFSRSMVRHTSAASSRVVSCWMTTVLPPVKAVKMDHCAAPCIIGGRGRYLPPPPFEASTIASTDANTSLCPKPRPPIAATKMSCWRHSTPLGMPVVPPV